MAALPPVDVLSPSRFDYKDKQASNWRGELITHQHTEAVGVNLAFGGREVACGFTGTYSDGEAEVQGTALVGKTSVLFVAVLKFQAPD